jgi:rubrerythrin
VEVALIDQKALAEELEALQYSLKTEEDGYSYYRDASERTDHLVAKKFFATLAEDEKEHINLINQFHSSMKENPEGADVELPESPGDHRKKLKTIFEEAQRDIKRNVPPDTGILEVYRHAMDLETKAANYYKERRDVTSFERSRKFFDWLFHFESYHYQMLSETLSYLQNPEQWFQAYEKSIFEG